MKIGPNAGGNLEPIKSGEELKSQLNENISRGGVGDVADSIEKAGTKLDDINLSAPIQHSLENIQLAFKNHKNPGDALRFLRGVGLPAVQVAPHLREIKISEAVVPSLLKEAGYSASEIAATLHDGYGYTADQVTQTLKDLGFSSEEIGEALRNEYQIGPSEIGEKLKAAGFDATDVAKGVKAAYSFDSGQMRDLLEGLGFSQGEIADAMYAVYGEANYTVLDP